MKSALIVVDVQTDFCPGGSLEVPDGHKIIPRLNSLMDEFDGLKVVTQDFHPPDHVSFFTSHEGKKPFQTIDTPFGHQKLWPVHCVEGTDGAKLRPDFFMADMADLILRKGRQKHLDSYSAFLENDRKTNTGLSGYLRFRQITKIYVVGLALDVCVKHTAMDGKRFGFDVSVIEDACRPISNPKKSINEMKNLGIKLE